MIKRTPNGIYVSDDLTNDMTRIKPELKINFVKRVRDYEQGGRIGVAPKLVATVAATHAGLPTGNMAFYTPDRMAAGLPSFTNTFAKPVLLHHDDHKDPVGRVYRATYKDLSHLYVQPMNSFKERYGGNVFTDAKVDLDKAFDQVDWVIQNMVPLKDYVGLGYGELDLHITDADAAAKIVDQRYLTVSVGFTTDSMYCSNCHQDWASEGFCEHERGKSYDDKQTLVIPGSFNYEEISWVNSPADSGAKVLSISETVSLADDNELLIPQTVISTQNSMCAPILISVSDGIVSRLDSFQRVTPERAQEVIEVSKQEDNTRPAAPTLIKVKIANEEFEFDTKASELLEVEDAKRENYITDQVNGHMHRVIIDPETGNGYMSYDAGHTHEVVNRNIASGGENVWDEDSGNHSVKDAHVHALDKKVPALTDEKEVEVEVEDAKEPKKKKKYKKVADSEVEGDDILELEDSVDAPEGYELIEDAVVAESTPKEFVLETYEDVVAARQLVAGATDITEAERYRYLANINKTAIEANLSPVADEFDVVEIELADPTNADATIKLAFTSEDVFLESLKEMTQEAVEANKDELERACTIFGVSLPSFEVEDAMGTPLSKREAQAQAAALFNTIDKAFVDALIKGFNEMSSDVERREAAEYLVDQLIAEMIIDNIFEDFNKIQQELQDTREKLAKVTKANRDFYAGKQDDLSRVVVALKVALKKPEFVDLNEEAIGAKISELKVRSIDSLQDSLNDLINEFSGKQVELEVNEVSDTPVEPTVGTLVDKQDNHRHNMEIFRDMNDGDYVIASNLQNRFKNRS